VTSPTLLYRGWCCESTTDAALQVPCQCHTDCVGLQHWYCMKKGVIKIIWLHSYIFLPRVVVHVARYMQYHMWEEIRWLHVV
jgi:hypothetical protein